MSGDEQALELARLGIDAEAFINSPLCKFLTELSEREEEGYLAQLRNVNPTDIEEVRRLQNELKVIDMFRGYLGEIVNSGKAAADRLAEQDAYED